MVSYEIQGMVVVLAQVASEVIKYWEVLSLSLRCLLIEVYCEHLSHVDPITSVSWDGPQADLMLAVLLLHLFVEVELSRDSFGTDFVQQV